MPPHEITGVEGTGDYEWRTAAQAARSGATGGDARRALRVGIGGPVGSGKTTLVGALCSLLRDELSMVVVTNDIFTSEDADALRRAAVLPTDRIVAVETGCCPHTAIRDDIAANLDAVEELESAHQGVDLTLIESGGDNLTAIFSRGLVDVQIFVLDTAGGDDVPRKGGPGLAMADCLVINKIDLAPYVGADLDRMLSDSRERRGDRPVEMTSLVDPQGASAIADWIRGLIADRRESLRGYGITDSGITGSGITGSGITGSGITGSGITGSGITGSGITGSGITGSGITGSGAMDTVS